MLPTSQKKPDLLRRIARYALELRDVDEALEKRIVCFLGAAVLSKYAIYAVFGENIFFNLVATLIDIAHITAVIMLLVFLVRKAYQYKVDREMLRDLGDVEDIK